MRCSDKALKQWIQSSHIPPCHRHMVITTILSVHCFALLHRSANQTSAECCLEFTIRVRLSNVSWAVWVSSHPLIGAGYP